jgi:hypothetical protein
MPADSFMQDVMERIEAGKQTMAQMRGVAALYLPMNPDILRMSCDQLEPVSQRRFLAIHDYMKPGDQLTLELDQETAQIRRIRIRTYLSSPQEVMTATVQYSQLEDGRFYPSTTTLEVRTAARTATSLHVTDFALSAAPKVEAETLAPA